MQLTLFKISLNCNRLGILTAMLVTAGTANAVTINLGVGAGGVVGDRILGEVINPTTAGGLLARDEAMIDAVRLMTTGQRTPTGSSPEYYRSTQSFGPLPDATQVGALFAGSIGDMTTSGTQFISITLPANTTFKYLVGAWDGGNGGAEIWFIGDVAGGTEILIPRYARPNPPDLPNNQGGGDNVWPQDLVVDDSQYQITTWSLFNPTTGTPTPRSEVPDSGGTVALLGLALSGVGLARRFMKKA